MQQTKSISGGSGGVSEGATLAAAEPLPFPSADGPVKAETVSPGRAPTQAPPAEALPSAPWFLGPALVGVPCMAAALAIGLRDGLGLSWVWALVVTLPAVAGAGLLLERRLSRPVQALSARVERLTVHFTGRPVARSSNPILHLAASFEALSAGFLAQIERLKRLHLDEIQNGLELQRRYALMRLLRALSTAECECESLERVLERALDELGAYLDWPIGRVLILDAAPQPAAGPRRSIWFAPQRQRFLPFIEAMNCVDARSPHSLTGRASAAAMPHWVTDLRRLDPWSALGAAETSGLKSGFVVPIFAGGLPHAFIEFFSDHRVEASAEMLELIEAVQTELWAIGDRCRVRHGGVAPRAAEDGRTRGAAAELLERSW